MPDLKGDARPWRVYTSPRGIRVTRRVIPPAEQRKGEREVTTLAADMDYCDAKALAMSLMSVNGIAPIRRIPAAQAAKEYDIPLERLLPGEDGRNEYGAYDDEHDPEFNSPAEGESDDQARA